MKKGLLILVPTLLLSLTACDLSEILNQLGGDSDEEESSQAINNPASDGGDDDSIFDKTESLEKLMAFGKNTGFEIKTSGSESGSASAAVSILGMKGNVWWVMDDEGYGTAYRLDNGVCSSLTYDSSSQTWSVLIANVGESQYTEMFASLANYLYKANTYFANEGFESDGSSVYAGRNVLKYKYHRAVATVSVDNEYYVDQELGITIYQYAATTSDGEISWAKIETTSFKTGNDVTAISIA